MKNIFIHAFDFGKPVKRYVEIASKREQLIDVLILDQRKTLVKIILV